MCGHRAPLNDGGAAHDEHGLQITVYEGGVNWMDPVTDEDYRAPARRR